MYGQTVGLPDKNIPKRSKNAIDLCIENLGSPLLKCNKDMLQWNWIFCMMRETNATVLQNVLSGEDMSTTCKIIFHRYNYSEGEDLFIKYSFYNVKLLNLLYNSQMMALVKYPRCQPSPSSAPCCWVTWWDSWWGSPGITQGIIIFRGRI